MGMSSRLVVLKTALVVSTFAAPCALLLGQTNPQNVPQPPNTELQKFEPFLGMYEVSGDFANLPWSGTLELKKVIKGWYIQQTIRLKSPGIDREFWVLSTWDREAQKYRLWGFQTLPTVLEGEIRFEGDEMITAWPSIRPDGGKVLSSNRYRFLSRDQLEIVSYRQSENGPIQKIGTLMGKRMVKIEAFSTTDSNEAELRAFMAELRKASIEGDVETAVNSITDDYVQTDINGYRQDKTTWLNEYFRPLADLIKAGKFHWDEYERTNLQFRFYGDCAVVTGELHAKGTGAKFGPQHTWVADPNASFSGTLHFTHVYIKQNGKWMLAALHNQTPLPPANAAK
jgi:ketosteroid isomerase-like protein